MKIGDTAIIGENVYKGGTWPCNCDIVGGTRAAVKVYGVEPGVHKINNP